MEVKKNESFISKKQLQEVLSNVNNFGFFIILVFCVSIFMVLTLIFSLPFLLPLKFVPIILYGILLLLIVLMWFILPRIKEFKQAAISYLEGKDIEIYKKIKPLLDRIKKSQKYLKNDKKKYIYLNFGITIFIIFSSLLFPIIYSVLNSSNSLSNYNIILAIIFICFLIDYSILVGPVILCMIFNSMMINSFKDLLLNLDIKFNNFIKYRINENSIQNYLKEIISDLNIWYKIYCASYFDNDDSNNIMFDYRLSYFSDVFIKYYFDVFLDLKTKVLDLEYRRESDRVEDQQFNYNIIKLKKILKNYIERLKLEIGEKRELKKMWQGWLKIITSSAVSTIIFIFSAIFFYF